MASLSPVGSPSINCHSSANKQCGDCYIFKAVASTVKFSDTDLDSCVHRFKFRVTTACPHMTFHVGTVSAKTSWKLSTPLPFLSLVRVLQEQ